ncbi:MAG: helix-turn-helix domain-containing protein [Tannerellaceae bacterium]
MINDNILSLLNKTPDSILHLIAERIKERRLEKNWTQKLLASKAGMPIATYRRFEREGEVSLRKLVMIAIALEMENDFDSLFTTKSYQSIDELIEQNERKQRKRANNDG